MHRPAKGRGCKKNQEFITQVRRRQSDARWRANVASCFETLKQVIPVNVRACKKQISKASILHETQKHIGFLETTLRNLLQAKAKCLQQRDGDSLTPREMLIDIHQEFISKQQESVTAFKEKKQKLPQKKMGLPYNTFLRKDHAENSQVSPSPGGLRNGGRCHDRQISPRTFTVRLLRRQLENSQYNDDEDIEENTETQGEMFACDELKTEGTDKTNQESQGIRQTRKCTSGRHVGKRIYEISPDREVEQINSDERLDHEQAFDEVDAVKSEEIKDLESVHDQPLSNLFIDEDKSLSGLTDSIKVEIKEETSFSAHDDKNVHGEQIVLQEPKEENRRSPKKPKFISLKYVGSLVPDQLDSRCIQKVTSCPVLGRVIVIAPGSSDSFSIHDEQKNLDILSSFKIQSNQHDAFEIQKVWKLESDANLFFNGKSVLEVTVRTSEPKTSASQFDVISSSTPSASKLFDLSKAPGKGNSNFCRPTVLKEVSMPVMPKSDDNTAENSNKGKSQTPYLSEIKMQPKTEQEETDKDLNASTLNIDSNATWWNSLEDPLTLPENPPTGYDLAFAPCGTPCLSISPGELFAPSADSEMGSTEMVYKRNLKDEVPVVTLHIEPKYDDDELTQIVPERPDSKLAQLHGHKNSDHQSDSEVPKSVYSSSECLNSTEATPHKTPNKPRVMITPQSTRKRYTTPNKERTSSISPARMPFAEFSTPAKRLHSPERLLYNTSIGGTPAHKRDRRLVMDTSSGNNMTPCKVPSLITPTRRPLMTYDSTPNKSSQSPSGSSLGFTPVRLPYDHAPTSPFSPFNYNRQRKESQSDWETESLRCDEDDICSDEEDEDTEKLTPGSRDRQKLNRKQNVKAKCRTVPHKGRRNRAPRGRPRCDSESSIRTLNSARASSEKHKPRLQGNKKSNAGTTPKCCRFLDLTHIDDNLEKSQHDYKPFHVSEYYDLHDQPDDFDRYLEEYQTAIDKSIRSSPGESDTTWSADEGEPIPSHINLIWQELMSSHSPDTPRLQFFNEGDKDSITPNAKDLRDHDVPQSMPNGDENENSEAAPSQVIPVLPDISEPYSILSISLTADSSLASSGDLSDDLKDIDIQPMFSDVAAEADLERICKQELNTSQDHEDSQPCSADSSQAVE